MLILYYGGHARRFRGGPASWDNHVGMSDTTTRGIRIHVRTGYMPERSSPRDNRYQFQYDVRISNVGSETAQLVSREWIITDADGGVQRHGGGGVIGQFPILKPGATFEYTSYCELKTAVGAMQGTYQMVTADGETFDAIIAPFTLAVPHALN
jgi:ApaG protein